MQQKKDKTYSRQKAVLASFGTKINSEDSSPVLSWNPTSLFVPGRLNELKKLVFRIKPALLAIQEWRSSEAPPALKGFHSIVRGLSLLYIRNDITYSVVEPADSFPNIHVVQILSNKCLYSAIYVHPLCRPQVFKSFLEHQNLSNKQLQKFVFGISMCTVLDLD